MAAIDSGDTAWLLTATALVFFMTPGLALFYAGLVPARSATTTLAYSLHALGVVSPLWLLLTYRAAFGPGPALLGAPGPVSSAELFAPRENTRVPEAAFCAFQLAFASITAAVVSGAVAARLAPWAWAAFAVAWHVLVYVPLARAVFHPAGVLAAWGVLDYAGGLPVETAAGVSSLVLAALVGPRRADAAARAGGAPHSVPLVVAGGGVLLLGWYGFNSGSALFAGGDAALALLNTHAAACTGALGWMAAEVAWPAAAHGAGHDTGAGAGAGDGGGGGAQRQSGGDGGGERGAAAGAAAAAVLAVNADAGDDADAEFADDADADEDADEDADDDAEDKNADPRAPPSSRPARGRRRRAVPPVARPRPTAQQALGWLWRRAPRASSVCCGGGRPTTVGAVSGLVAGLVAVTPAAGYISAPAALALGALAGPISRTAVHALARAGVDDALEGFGCHGVAGMLGVLYTGALAARADGAPADGPAAGGGLGLLGKAAAGVAVTVAVAAAGTAAAFALVAAAGRAAGWPLRVADEADADGAEAAYTLPGGGGEGPAGGGGGAHAQHGHAHGHAHAHAHGHGGGDGGGARPAPPPPRVAGGDADKARAGGAGGAGGDGGAGGRGGGRGGRGRGGRGGGGGLGDATGGLEAPLLSGRGGGGDNDLEAPLLASGGVGGGEVGAGVAADSAA